MTDILDHSSKLSLPHTDISLAIAAKQPISDEQKLPDENWLLSLLLYGQLTVGRDKVPESDGAIRVAGIQTAG